MKYLIKKGGLYVAKPGSHKSYTTLRDKAQVFNSLEEAKRNCCGNETVVSYYDDAEKHCKTCGSVLLLGDLRWNECSTCKAKVKGSDNA